MINILKYFYIQPNSNQLNYISPFLKKNIKTSKFKISKK